MKRLAAIIILIISVMSAFGAVCETDAETPMEIAQNAKEIMLEYWKNEVYMDPNYAEMYIDRQGIVDIRSTRLFAIKDKPCEPGRTYDESTNAKRYFDGVEYVVEFVLFTEYIPFLPCAFNSSTYDHVVFYRDGSVKVMPNPFNYYCGRTYDYDLSGIIDEVYDLGSELNGSYSMLVSE